MGATQGDVLQADAIAMKNAIKAADGYEKDIRLNMSLTYELDKTTWVQLFVQNLAGYNDNKRYHFDTGNSENQCQ